MSIVEMLTKKQPMDLYKWCGDNTALIKDEPHRLYILFNLFLKNDHSGEALMLFIDEFKPKISSGDLELAKHVARSRINSTLKLLREFLEENDLVGIFRKFEKLRNTKIFNYIDDAIGITLQNWDNGELSDDNAFRTVRDNLASYIRDLQNV